MTKKSANSCRPHMITGIFEQPIDEKMTPMPVLIFQPDGSWDCGMEWASANLRDKKQWDAPELKKDSDE